MANSFLSITLLFSTLAGFGYGKLCTDLPQCNRENPFTGEAVITPDLCNQLSALSALSDIRSTCPGRCGVTCCDFYSYCDVISNPTSACAASPVIKSRCPEKCSTCAAPANMVEIIAGENCTNNALTDVTITRVDPEDLKNGFRCCFDNTMQPCNDPLVDCNEAMVSFQQAELICQFRGGHLCTAEETRMDCCLSHRCADDTTFTNRTMWLGSPNAAPTAVPTMAPPTAPPTPAPTVAPTTEGCSDKYEDRCTALSTGSNFQHLCDSDSAYRRMCKKSCGRC